MTTGSDPRLVLDQYRQRGVLSGGDMGMVFSVFNDDNNDNINYLLVKK